MVRSGFRALSLISALLFVSPSVFAQTDAALSETLFQEGRRLMDAGKYAEACPKLQESQRLDPGTGTLLNLGRCLKEAGKPASAWVTFNEAVASARAENRADRVALAQGEIKKLEDTMPRLSVVVPPEADVQGLSIHVDEATISPAARGVASPVDPGDHRISASAPGRKTWTNTVSVRPGAQTHTVVIPVLEPGTGTAGADGQSAALAATPNPSRGVAEPPPPRPPSGGLRELPPRPRRLMLGLRVDAAIPLGTIAHYPDPQQTGSEKFKDWSKVQGGLWLEGGYRITPQFLLGAYLVANFGGVGSELGPDHLAICGAGAASCSTIDVRIGLQGQYSFLPEGSTHPWVGAGIGYEVWSIGLEVMGESGSYQFAGPEWLLLQGGADFDVGRAAMGPFLAFSLGRFTSSSITCDGCSGTTDVDIEKPAFHQWLTLGARGTFSL
jgi:hypothetical protein